MREHGDYLVDRYNQLILFAGRGPWNDQALKRGTKETAALLQAIDRSAPWAQLSLIFGESLMTPSMLATFIKQTNIRKTLGLSALAIVITDSDVSTTIKRQLHQVYQQAGIEHAFLDSIEEGVSWLSQKGFNLPADKLNEFLSRCRFLPN